jgi:hypothetical protein
MAMSWILSQSISIESETREPMVESARDIFGYWILVPGGTFPAIDWAEELFAVMQERKRATETKQVVGLFID